MKISLSETIVFFDVCSIYAPLFRCDNSKIRKNKADCVSLKNAGEHSPLWRFCKDITMMLRIFEQKNKTAVSPRPFSLHKILINRLKAIARNTI